MSQPWDRQEGETSKAYAAFVAYLELGPERSIDAAFRQQNGSRKAAGRPFWWHRWSSKWSWVARAEAFDHHELTEKIEARAEVRERLRQQAIDNADMALAEIVALCQYQGSERPETAARVRLNACEKLLSLAGVDGAKRVEVSGPEGGAVKVITPAEIARRVDELISDMSDDEVATLEDELPP